MKSLSKIVLLIIGLSVIGLSATAQGYKLYAGNVPSQNAVELKWFSKTMQKNTQYNLYRKADGTTTWTKLNSEPLQAVKPMTDDEMKKRNEAGKKDDELFLVSYILNTKYKNADEENLSYSGLLIQAIDNNKTAKYLGIYFVDETIEKGTTYEYKVVSVQGKTENDLAHSVAIKVLPYAQPEAPSDFIIEGADRKVMMKWKYNAQFPQYRITRASVPGGKADTVLYSFPSRAQIDSAAKKGWLYVDADTLLVNGKTYFYKVCGVDIFGHETQLSKELSASTKDLTPPAAVTRFRAEIKGKGVRLVWRPVLIDCKGYSVYRSTKKDVGFVKLSPELLSKTDSVFIDNTAAESTGYYYYIENEDAGGNKSKSPVVTYTLPDLTPPKTPTGLKARTDTGKITLMWDANTENDLAGYYIFRSLKIDNNNFTLLNKMPWKANSYLDTLPKEASNAFLYKICAVDKSFNRSETTPVLAAKMPDIMAPTPPTITNLTSEGKSVLVEWSKTSAPDVKSYEVFRKTANGGIDTMKAKVGSVDAGTLRFSDATVQLGKTYSYYLLALDSSGNKSGFSTAKSIRAGGKTKLSPPKLLTCAYTMPNKSVVLTWQAEDDIAGYKVYRDKDDAGFVPITNWGVASSFEDKLVEKTHRYTYKIVAIGNDGELTEASNLMSITVSDK